MHLENDNANDNEIQRIPIKKINDNNKTKEMRKTRSHTTEETRKSTPTNPHGKREF